MKPATSMLLATACLLAAGAAPAAGPVAGCLPAVSVPIAVRIGDASVTAAQLEGGSQTPLSVFESGSRRLLWSAAAHTAATQQFAGLDTTVAGSLVALDLNGDGLHDRVYAGDLAGRLWRFDLHHGAPAPQWATGSVFADLRNDEGRGFLAAPDVSLAAPPGVAPWLHIAIGTAAPGNARASNRLYVLRDGAVHETWTRAQHAAWEPLRESDLERVEAPSRRESDAATVPPGTSPGWYVELGGGHVLVPTLTVEHRLVLAIAAAVPRTGAACEVLTRIAEIDLQQQQIRSSPDAADWRTPLPMPAPAGAGLTLHATAASTVHCSLAGQRIAACDIDGRPRRTWWRRSDAE